MVWIPCLAIFISIVLPVVCSAADNPSKVTKESPMKVEVKKRASVERFYDCMAKVSITNRHDRPTWFVMSYFANEFLIPNGRFGSWEKTQGQPFEVLAYDEGHGRLNIFNYYGTNGFRAILLPPRGNMQFEQFVFENVGNPPRFVEVWEVGQLLVNGKSVLQEWLPYAVESSREIHISEKMYSDRRINVSFRHEKNPSAKPYPKEKVEFIKGEALGRYVISLPE